MFIFDVSCIAVISYICILNYWYTSGSSAKLQTVEMYTVLTILTDNIRVATAKFVHVIEICFLTSSDKMSFITPQPLGAVGVLFSPMVSGWAGGGKKFVRAISQKK